MLSFIKRLVALGAPLAIAIAMFCSAPANAAITRMACQDVYIDGGIDPTFCVAATIRWVDDRPILDEAEFTGNEEAGDVLYKKAAYNIDATWENANNVVRWDSLDREVYGDSVWRTWYAVDPSVNANTHNADFFVSYTVNTREGPDIRKTLSIHFPGT